MSRNMDTCVPISLYIVNDKRREDLFALSQDELHRKYDKLSYKEICELNDKT